MRPPRTSYNSPGLSSGIKTCEKDYRCRPLLPARACRLRIADKEARRQRDFYPRRRHAGDRAEKRPTVQCRDQAQCDKSWALTKNYVQQHSDTSLIDANDVAIDSDLPPATAGSPIRPRASRKAASATITLLAQCRGMYGPEKGDRVGLRRRLRTSWTSTCRVIDYCTPGMARSWCYARFFIGRHCSPALYRSSRSLATDNADMGALRNCQSCSVTMAANSSQPLASSDHLPVRRPCSKVGRHGRVAANEDVIAERSVARFGEKAGEQHHLGQLLRAFHPAVACMKRVKPNVHQQGLARPRPRAESAVTAPCSGARALLAAIVVTEEDVPWGGSKLRLPINDRTSGF